MAQGNRECGESCSGRCQSRFDGEIRGRNHLTSGEIQYFLIQGKQEKPRISMHSIRRPFEGRFFSPHIDVLPANG
jgi:hypothetical protein